MAVAAFATTVAWAALPGTPIARDPALHLALEVTAGLITTLAAFVMAGRFRQDRRGRDLALTVSLGALAVCHLGFTAIPAVAGDGRPTAFSVWAAMAGSLVAGLVFVGTARLGRRRVRPRAGAVAFAATVLALTGIAAAAAALAPGAAVGAAHGTAGGLIHVTGVVLFLAAAVVFARRARQGDTLMGWLAVSAVLAAAARGNFLLFPTLYTADVGPGDAFRLLAHAALLVGAIGEISASMRAHALAQVADERRRIAREIHDGVAQELAFVVRRSQSLDAPDIQAAAARALDDVRRAMHVLRDPEPQDFARTFAGTMQGVAARSGASVDVRVGPDLGISEEDAHALLKVGAEAVANAGRCSTGGRIEVELSRAGGSLRLCVRDRGPGLVAAPRPGRTGLGLAGMAERAAAIGAELTLRPRDGGGTEVELVRR